MTWWSGASPQNTLIHRINGSEYRRGAFDAMWILPLGTYRQGIGSQVPQRRRIATVRVKQNEKFVLHNLSGSAQNRRMSFRHLGHVWCTATLLACGCTGLRAQCLVPFPGGSKVNPNRPRHPETPAAAFSTLPPANRLLPS